MVPHIGTNINKQIISTKTFRFGYKIFLLSSNDGYPYFLDPYCGAKYEGGELSKNICAYSILDCITLISDWSDKEVFFDNWFSLVSLLQLLKRETISVTSTI